MRKDPAALFLDDDLYRERLYELLQCMFQSQTSKKGNDKKQLALSGFTLAQVWAQLTHHTEKANNQALNQLNALVGSEDFLRALADEDQDT